MLGGPPNAARNCQENAANRRDLVPLPSHPDHERDDYRGRPRARGRRNDVLSRLINPLIRVVAAGIMFNANVEVGRIETLHER